MNPSLILHVFFIVLCLMPQDAVFAQERRCQNSQPYEAVADQASGIEQSWHLTNQVPSVLGSRFSQTIQNRHFGYSFQDIPLLYEATLTIEARPISSSPQPGPSDSSNDRLNIQVRDQKFRWSRSFGDLVAPSAWHPSSFTGWQTLTLSLSNLAGNVNLSNDLLMGRLDIYIQDDTAVRSITLSGKTCPGPGISRTTCCGDGVVAWGNSSHLFGLHVDGNIKRAFYQPGGGAQWILAAGSSPIVPGSFAPLDEKTIMMVNDLGQVIKVSPSGSAIIPKTSGIHPCSLVATEKGIYGVNIDNGHVVLIHRDNGTIQSAAPWGPADRPIETSLIGIGDGRVAGVSRNGRPWNVWFDASGQLQWSRIGEIDKVQVP